MPRSDVRTPLCPCTLKLKFTPVLSNPVRSSAQEKIGEAVGLCIQDVLCFSASSCMPLKEASYSIAAASGQPGAAFYLICRAFSYGTEFFAKEIGIWASMVA